MLDPRVDGPRTVMVHLKVPLVPVFVPLATTAIPYAPSAHFFFSVVLRGRCASLLWPFPSKHGVGIWTPLNGYTTCSSCLRDGNPVNSIPLGGKVFGDQKSCAIKDGMNLPSKSQQEKGQKGLLRVRMKGFPISSRRGNFQVRHLE